MKKNFIIIILLALCQNLFSQEWIVQIEHENKWGFWDDITVDEGESVLGIGQMAKADGFVVKIDKDGAFIERVVHLPGMMLCYHSAVQLDNGNYMVFGICDDSLCDPYYQRYIQVDVFDNNLELISSRAYGVEDDTFDCFAGANEGVFLNSILSPIGTVILAAAPSYYYVDATGYGYYKRALQLYELDREGNILVKKPHITAYVGSIREITYEPHSDNLLIALTGGLFPPNYQGTPGIYVVNMNLEIVARQHLIDVQGGWQYEVDPIVDITTDGKWIDSDHLLLHTMKIDRDHRSTFTYSSLYKLDSTLNVYGELRLPPYDSCTWIPNGTSTVYINDSTIFVFTYCSESIYSFDTQQANVLLVDKHLNLLGRKTIRQENVLAYVGIAAVFNDGGCLVPILQRNSIYYQGEPFFYGDLVKFRREDIEITWDVVHEDGSEPKLAPYPNPTDGIVNIPIPENTPNNARIQLFDAGGIKSLDKSIGQSGNLIRLDTGNLASGLYLYRIVAGNGTVAEGKFIKN